MRGFGLRRRLVRLLMGAGRGDGGERALAELAYRQILRRAPSEAELERAAQLAYSLGPARYLEEVFASDEYQFRNRVAAQAEFDAGHYYSPVVDPEALAAAGFSVDRDVPGSALPGLELDDAAMRDLWDALLPAMQTAQLPAVRTEGRRYYAQNEV